MKAMVIEAYGGFEVFKCKDLPDPAAPPPGHLLLRVEGTSVNPLDYKIRKGFFKQFTPTFPAVLHGDVAGIVTAVGEGVTEFQVGDQVYGCAGGVGNYPGALAEYMLVDASLVAHKPKTLNMEESAALPLVAITAWEALIDRLKIGVGQTLLIHAGTGGVGHIALQLAKTRGAKVAVTVSSKEKAALAIELGADDLILYKNERVDDYVKRITNGRGFDFIFDTIGGSTLDASFAALAPFGQIATIAAAASHDLTPLFVKNGTLHMVIMLAPLLSGQGRAEHGKILREVAKLADEGLLRPLIDKERFTFRDVGKAHERLESGQAIGKVVLSPSW